MKDRFCDYQLRKLKCFKTLKLRLLDVLQVYDLKASLPIARVRLQTEQDANMCCLIVKFCQTNIKRKKPGTKSGKG